jgi:membrane protease subunit HflK
MSLNDPQWGRKPGRGGAGNNNPGGPPDLDEIWNNLGQKLNNMLGRKGGAGGDGGEPPRRAIGNLPLGGMGLLIAIVLLIWLASGFYIVDQGRRGIVLTFGRYTETTKPRSALAPALSHPERRSRQPVTGQDGRGRISRQPHFEDAQGIADADR